MLGGPLICIKKAGMQKRPSAVSDDCGNHISRYVGALIFSGVFAKALLVNSKHSFWYIHGSN